MKYRWGVSSRLEVLGVNLETCYPLKLCLPSVQERHRRGARNASINGFGGVSP